LQIWNVHEANAIGIMMGIGGNQIAPKGNTTVEQSILMSLRVFNEYLPLIENAAPAQLPTAVVTYNVNEGESLDILLEDLAYDADGDALTISGVSGNQTYGRLMNHTAHVTFTAEEVDADQVSVWTMTVSDGVESVSIELTFNVIDVPSGNPESNGVTSFTINEGESITIKPSDIAIDPEGDLMHISSYTLSGGYSSEIGDSIKYLALFGVENSFGFTADPVDGDTTTSYDLTVSDGTNESVFTIEIHVKEVNAPPVGLPMTTRYQDERQFIEYSVNTIATDPDGDDLEIVSFKLNDDPQYASSQHNLGTGHILNIGGTDYFTFLADELDMSMWTYYDMTISDGLNEVVVTIRIQVNNVD